MVLKLKGVSWGDGDCTSRRLSAQDDNQASYLMASICGLLNQPQSQCSSFFPLLVTTKSMLVIKTAVSYLVIYSRSNTY